MWESGRLIASRYFDREVGNGELTPCSRAGLKACEHQVPRVSFPFTNLANPVCGPGVGFGPISINVVTSMHRAEPNKYVDRRIYEACTITEHTVTFEVYGLIHNTKIIYFAVRKANTRRVDLKHLPPHS